MLILQSASAGSGKTDFLVKHLCEIFIKDEALFSSSHSITFTCKSRYEIKVRFIEHLKKLSGKTANCLYRKFLFYYHDFNVSTVDSFFQDLLKKYYPHGCNWIKWTTCEDSIVDAMLDNFWKKIDEEHHLWESWKDYAYKKWIKGKSFSIKKEMLDLAHIVLRFPEKRILLAEKEIREKKLKSWKQTVQRLKEETNLLVERLWKQVSVFSNEDIRFKKKGLHQYLFLRKEGNDIKTNSYIYSFTKEQNNWFSSKSEHKEKIEAMSIRCRPLLQTLLLKDEKMLHIKSTLDVLRPLQIASSSLSFLIQGLSDHIRKGNSMPLSYAPLLLNNCSELNKGKPEIILAIDEAQDISHLQWTVLRKIIKNNVKKLPHTMVGDAKQSIYRWRGSYIDLLLSQVEKEIKKEHIIKKSLLYNWRSAPAIVTFNNLFFAHVGYVIKMEWMEEINKNQLGSEEKEEINNRVKQIQELYSIPQKVPQKQSDVNGKISFVLLKSIVYKKLRFLKIYKEVVEHIKRLQDKKIPLNDITILVRNHEEANFLYKALLEENRQEHENGYYFYAEKASSFFFKDIPLLKIIFAALHFIDVPSVTNVIILRSLFQSREEAFTEAETVSKKKKNISNVAGFIKRLRAICKKKFQKKDVLEAIFYLYDIIGWKKPEDKVAFDILVDTVSQEIKKCDSRLILTKWWDEIGSMMRWPLPIQTDCIQIMTIHQSKGLAYEHVIIPFTQWLLDHLPQKAPVIWAGKESFPVYYNKRLCNTFFAIDYYVEKMLSWMENINILYVAMTRARQSLHVIVSNYNTNRRVCSFFSSFIPSQSFLQKEREDIWAYGDIFIKPEKQTAKIKKILELPDNPIKGYKYDVICKKKNNSIKEGSWWHALLSNITKGSDIWSIFNLHCKNAMLSECKRSQRLKIMQALLRQKELSKLILSDVGTHYIERSIVDEQGNIVRPDRVIIKDHEAIVIEFKSKQKIKNHKLQIQYYMQLLKKMGYRLVYGIIYYLQTDELKKWKL